MAKLKKPAAKEPEKVEIDSIRQRIAGEIFRRYGMNVAEFCRSKECDKLGLDGKNLPFYLSGKVVSFSALALAYEKLELGTLTRKQVRTTEYFVAPK